MMRLFLTLSLAFSLISVQAQIPADHVFYGGKVYTANDDQPFATAIVVHADTIVYVGGDDGALQFAGDGTAMHDIDGKLVLPGLHDVHIHLLEASSEAAASCILNWFASDAYELAQDLNACNPQPNSNGWILSWGHSIYSLLDAPEMPKTILDNYFPVTPVAAMDETSHSIWVNSAALEELGFDSESPDPEGGHIVKDLETGEPNGLLLDNAGELALQLAMTADPAIDAMNYDGLVNYGLPELAENGITSICEGRTYWKRNYIETWQELEANGELTARVVLAPWLYPEDDDEELITALTGLYDEGTDMLRVTQVKCYMDGITINGTAALDQPYVYNFGWPFTQGLNYFSPERLESFITALEPLGYDFHIHAIGNRGVSEGLDAIEAARNTNGDIGARHRLTHLELVNEADYSRFAELNVTADMQVAGFWSQPIAWSDNIDLIGEELSEIIIPLKSLHEAGANVTLSSDWDVSTMNPFKGMQNAVTRDPQELPTREDAVKAYTINAAKVMRQETQTGSLEPGKWADLICVDRDLFTIPTSQIQLTQVTMTMVGGNIVFDNGGFPNSIQEAGSLDFQVYPTVVSNELFIWGKEDASTPIVLSVFDMSGKCVWKETVLLGNNLEHPLYVTAFSEGVYVVQLTSTQGEIIHQNKFVVSR